MKILAGNQQGITLLEMIIVIGIMAMLAAMLYPAAGMLDNRERAKISREKMEEIRRAMVGDPDRFDEHGRRVIGGFVGDMGRWPHLYEAKAEVKQHVTGTPPDFNLNEPGNPDIYHYRPEGSFGAGKNWQWHFPYRQLTDDTTYNNDHIGGLETENEGQPVGLWTDNPSGDGAGMLDRNFWRGPYLTPPFDRKPANAAHFAENDTEFAGLEPEYDSSLLKESWEDGDYTHALGEHFDQKEEFRLRQTDNRLADGWNRAFRFFISGDPARPGDSIFWIISEGGDFEGTYPNKGTFLAGSWADDPLDKMSAIYESTNQRGYNEDDPKNRDNIVMKIYSHEWEAIFEEENRRKKEETQVIIKEISRAIVGDALPHATSFNNGFTGSLCRLPRLFQWEAGPPASSWDEQDAANIAYTKGQPRGLWTSKPNAADSADDLAAPSLTSPGIGWRGAFIQPPAGHGADELLVDGWGREVLFFNDANNALLILSRGADGLFDFYDTDTLPVGAPDGINDFIEPANPVEVVNNISTYNPADTNGYNADNIISVIPLTAWKPGWFELTSFTVLNALNTYKAAFYYGYDPVARVLLSTVHSAAGATLVDADGDGTADDWQVGSAGSPAFLFTGTSANEACTGSRQLVIWDDADGNNQITQGDQITQGEQYHMKNYNILSHAALEPRTSLTVDTSLHFIPAP